MNVDEQNPCLKKEAPKDRPAVKDTKGRPVVGSAAPSEVTGDASLLAHLRLTAGGAEMATGRWIVFGGEHAVPKEPSGLVSGVGCVQEGVDHPTVGEQSRILGDFGDGTRSIQAVIP